MSESTKPPDLDALLAPQLRRDEHLVWAAQPIPRMIIKREIGGMIIGVVLVAASMAGMASLVGGLLYADHLEAVTVVAQFAFLLINVVVALAPGLLFLSGPYWSWRKAIRTHYVLTNQRAILFQASWLNKMTIHSCELSQLARHRRVQFADGSGHIFFVPPRSEDDRRQKTPAQAELGFIGITNVRDVGGTIDKLIRAEQAVGVP
jgi:hypothetical protein